MEILYIFEKYMKINLPSQASLMTQTVKNPPAMRETWVQSLGWEDPLEEDMAAPLQYSSLENSVDGGSWRGTVHGVTKSWARLSD